MFSSDLTLNEFACAIAICQPEADLGSILRIFHQTNCHSLAIPGKNNTWSTISSQNLLVLLAKSWQKLPVAMVSHPKKTPHQRNLAFNTIEDFHYLIEPAIICQGDTRLEDFLQFLHNDSLHRNQDKYLIVNAAGKLQGKLDKDKLLRYLASRFDRYTTSPRLSNSSISLLDLLDNLSLPLKIETAENKDYYLNQCWQKLISHNREKHLPQSPKSNISIANWWIEKQFDALQQNSGEQHEQINSADDFCCLGDKYYSPDRSDCFWKKTNLADSNRETSKLQQPVIEYVDNLAISCLIDNLQHKSVANCSFKIERGIEWNYIKIPLTLNKRHLETATTLNWLVLGIKSSLLESGDSQRANSVPAAKTSTIDNLLSSISHELKSPLTGIIGLSKLLNSEKLGRLNQRQAHYSQLIYNSGQKLISIVNSLIELTNLTAGNLEPKLEKIDLESLCRQVYQQIITKVELVEPRESNLAIVTSKLELNIEPGWKKAIADRSRLSSILTHLLWETFEFIEGTSCAIEIKIQQKSELIAITVGNNLADISVSSESTQSTDSFNSGVGLNLIIAKYLAETIQGNINSIYSANNNCAFTVLLPIANPEADILAAKSHLPQTIKDNVPKNLTVLCLYPEPEVIDRAVGNNSALDFNLKDWAEQHWSNNSQPQSYYRHRIIEADGLEQAHTLARIWQLDVIVLDGYQIAHPDLYLRSLQESKYLSALPLITLDTKTTEAANQIEGLNVYPCLLPAKCRSIKDLMQVIQIATGVE
ncbi:HAMP domain-containing histidine kinase [Waterburya agarophytonicola K14]|uniref:histidine kinase n=1 Tax=Waterburya agarophytonicola KI4 TaxID=2874699 RepID=A0A964BRR9_9CYAN|nr:HAMP domain-containing sensor histidine kinase [Waterburya agarophytonicola]MCC0177621.1 HAMP domain-containing histidine kinase [Waterburya agarophytonicola KI4]